MKNKPSLTKTLGKTIMCAGWLTAGLHAAPFDQAKIDAGIEVWRNQPDSRGRSCADCHGAPDAFDLAYFNFSDDDIRRRGTPNHIGTVDTEKVVELVREIRKKYDITNPVDPRTTRVFQPGGTPLAGANPTERDAAFMQELQTKIPILATGNVNSKATADSAIAELLAYDLRTERNGILFPIWSEDIFFGQQHGRLTDWISDEGMIANNAAARAVIQAAEDAYLADPTEEKFWAMYSAELNNSSVRSTVTNGNQRDLHSDKYFNSVIGSHDLRMTLLGQPRIMDKANTRHTQFYGNNLVFPTFMIGDNVNSVGSFSSEIKSSLDPTITDEHHVSAGKDAWWWVGFQYNNSFEHEPERQEYFPNSLGDNSPPRRVDQGSGSYTGHSLFLRARSDFSLFRTPHPVTGEMTSYASVRHNPLAPFNTAPAIGISVPINPDTSSGRWATAAHRLQYIKMAINVSKARLYAMKEALENGIAAGRSGSALNFDSRGDWADLVGTRHQLAIWDAPNATHNNALITQVEELRQQAQQGSTVPVIGSGNGLTGEYHNSLDFSNLVATRTDAKVDFVNPAKFFGGADGAIFPTASGNLSVRWTGYYSPKFSQNHSFWMFMAGDDMEWPLSYPQPNNAKGRVWVDGVEVFDMWTTTKNLGLTPNPRVSFPSVYLEAGRAYEITVEYKQTGGYQRASLWHKSGSQVWEPVAQSQLYTSLPAPGPPAAPNNLVLTRTTGTEINVQWTDYSYNETGFTIQRKTGAGGTWANIQTVGANVTNVADPGLSTSTVYFYRVLASNAQGSSAYSAEASISSSPGPDVSKLLVYEGFDHGTGGPVAGTNGGVGWASGSSWASNGSTSVVGALSFSDYPVMGNAAKLTTTYNSLTRDIGITRGSGSDVWISYLFKDDSWNDYNDEDIVSLSDASGTKFRSAPKLRGSGSAVAVDSGFGSASGTKLANNNVYLIVVKYTKLGAGTSGSPQTATMWALSAANYDAIKAGGVTEAELDANRTMTASDSFTGSKSLNIGDTFKYYNRRSGQGYIDEIKLATTLQNLFETQ